jgi:uncharacterized membrane protein
MKKTALFCAFVLAATASLSAAPKGNTKLGQMQGQDEMVDCTQLTPDEQNFSNQLMDMNNRNMFCTQFTRQQRQQAMQMMGRQDDSGNMMNADQSVQQVMQMGGMSSMNNQQNTRASCAKLSSDEQNFSNQLMDMNNRNMFCTQFTKQQRQQAMRMMGQQDVSGNTMNADQSVQQVMQMGGMSPMSNQQKGRASGGCPVK